MGALRSAVAFAIVFYATAVAGATPMVIFGGDPSRMQHMAVAKVLSETPEQSSVDQPKSLASGVYMSGNFLVTFYSGNVVTITLDQINNTSGFATSTLRLALWAVTSVPARATGVTGYRLVDFSPLNPLLPQNYYSNITRTANYTPPPNGTYWLVLSLDEYVPANCPGSTDGYCEDDSFVSFSQWTWGITAPPSALENPAAGSFQSGIGLISGWSCQGPVTVTVDGVATSAPYGGPRADTASVCSGNSSTGFGLLVNYNNFGSGVHVAQLYVNGVPSGNAHQFTVTVPSGEFMTGLSRSVTVPDFPSPGRNTTLIWQESQQNFAIQSVFP